MPPRVLFVNFSVSHRLTNGAVQAGVQIATGMWVDRSAVKSQGDNLDAFGRQMKEVFGLDLCDMTGFAPPTSLV